MRILFFLTSIFFCTCHLHAHASRVQDSSRILRLLFTSVEDKGKDFVAFARVSIPALDFDEEPITATLLFATKQEKNRLAAFFSLWQDRAGLSVIPTE